MKLADKTLNVLAVAAGFGGLSAAVKYRSHKMEVTLIEKYIDIRLYIDIFDFDESASIKGKWNDGSVVRINGAWSQRI